MRFLIDMPLSPALAVSLREQGHDAVHAAQSNLDRATDEAIIDRARSESRTSITADLDYPRLLALAQTTNPSLILFRDGDWGDAELAARLNEVLRTFTESEVSQSIIVIEHSRVRRRRLPIGA